MTTTELKTASVLAFERKLDPSDALFASGSWDARGDAAGWPAITIREKSVRGTISNRLKTKDQDPAKLDASIENPNLQTVDVATLPASADTLKAQFTLRVLGSTGTPSACNNAPYRAKLLQTVQAYKDATGFAELARRYAVNIANGRFLWRNRIGAESVEIQVSRMQDGRAASQWTFSALNQPWRSFDIGSDQALCELATAIEEGLAGRGYVLLAVTAFVRVGAGQEVFPSQELILDKSTRDKSKTLYKVGDVAAMHSQKIGNALRTIDTWYAEFSGTDDSLGPIAVEPYGSVTSQGKAYRQPKAKQDFYTLLDRWVLKDEVPSIGNQHYVIANLIRGGVFGDSDKG
ncbi:type I-F CRISPR-associated protein Csy3 [Hydrocarboniphaga sp.]|uniref:type I-F CRISPR-associated protein Csy3 n=1 Tax=Hydrocarboniphaga sp. TaxID=2033016 RepID=UPI003D124E0B